MGGRCVHLYLCGDRRQARRRELLFEQVFDEILALAAAAEDVPCNLSWFLGRHWVQYWQFGLGRRDFAYER